MCIWVMLLLLSRMILMIQTADNVQHLGHNDLPYAAHSQLLPLLSNTLPMDRWNNYIGQVNNVACYFDKLTWRVRLKLHQSYCSSLFGCELIYAIEPLTVVLLNGFVLHGERS